MTYPDQHDAVDAAGSPAPDDTRPAPEPEDDRFNQAKRAEAPQAQPSPQDRR